MAVRECGDLSLNVKIGLLQQQQCSKPPQILAGKLNHYVVALRFAASRNAVFDLTQSVREPHLCLCKQVGSRLSDSAAGLRSDLFAT